jgi:hypothetical protein
MGSFVKLNENSVVIQGVVVNNAVFDDLPFPESEPIGVKFLQDLYNDNAVWKQTSYNNNFRVRFAGLGYTYDATLDAFIRPKPYPSWLLNTTTTEWVAPVPLPTDGKPYTWNEATQSWDPMNEN